MPGLFQSTITKQQMFEHRRDFGAPGLARNSCSSLKIKYKLNRYQNAQPLPDCPTQKNRSTRSKSSWQLTEISESLSGLSSAAPRGGSIEAKIDGAHRDKRLLRVFRRSTRRNH